MKRSFFQPWRAGSCSRNQSAEWKLDQEHWWAFEIHPCKAWHVATIAWLTFNYLFTWLKGWRSRITVAMIAESTWYCLCSLPTVTVSESGNAWIDIATVENKSLQGSPASSIFPYLLCFSVWREAATLALSRPSHPGHPCSCPWRQHQNGVEPEKQQISS